MLDENLPTFRFRASSDTSLASVVYFSQHGSDPAAEYVFKRADPSTNPASRSKYAAALTDPYSSSVVYAEVLVEPEWQQPTLSTAEIRAQNGVAAAPVPLVPDNFVIQLYDPDQRIPVKMIPGSWNKTDSWEFEMPTQSFKLPSSSQLDRQQNDDVVRDITPKIMLRWKKDGRLSKDMTCYNVGRSLGKHKSKEPDITVALYKQARESALTIYEPNLQRVEVEDRKGLDIVLLLGAEVIKDLYLVPRPDVFNIAGASAAGAAASAGKRKNSRPTGAPSPPLTMSGAMGPTHTPSPHPPQTQAAAIPAARPEVDAETKRVQAMVEKEEKERQRRDREEQKRIKKMLEVEDKERRRKEAEVEKETERLRKMYGVEGQALPSSRPANGPSPSLPPRPPPGSQVTFATPPPNHLGPPGGQPGWFGPPPARPVSAGPTPGPFNSSTINSWWRGPSGGGTQAFPPPQQQQRPSGRQRGSSGPYANNAAASASGFFHRDRAEDDRRKVHKKRSVHF